ncbi:ribonuclease H-like domain-containing protein, partial [Tanacetum coccineum]
ARKIYIDWDLQVVSEPSEKLRAMKMEHYLVHTDYLIWEVIQKGNGPVSVFTDTHGVIKVLPPKTAEEILAKERERKARTTLLMALPKDHLSKFHKMTDAKEKWEAIKSRFGGNDESKKMQKYILKQQFKGFSVSNSEGLHKGYDRFQSLLSQLEIHGAGVTTEDTNQKFLRSLPSAWVSIDNDCPAKIGIYQGGKFAWHLTKDIKKEEKLFVHESARAIKHKEVSTVGAKIKELVLLFMFIVETVCAKNSNVSLQNKQPNELDTTSLPLAHTDYPIWEVIQKGNGPISVSTDTHGVIKVLPPKTAEEILAKERERKERTTLLMALPEDHLAKFHKITDAKEITNEVSTTYGASSSSDNKPQREGSSSYANDLIFSFFANQSSGPQLDHEDLEQLNEFDLEEIDLKWQVAMISMRIKKSKGNQESRRRDAWNSGYKAKDNGTRPGKQEETKALVTLDGDGVDWTSHSEDEQDNYAFMAYSSSGSDTEVTSCSKECKESYAKIKKLYDEQREQLGDASIEIQAYTQALKKVEAQLVAHQQNQLWYEEKIRFMKIDLDDKTDVLTYHKKLLAEAEKEKEELKAKVEKWHNSSKSLNILLNSQMSARDKVGLGYGDQMNKGVLSYENEVFGSLFNCRSSDIEDSPVNNRYAEGMHAVPPPMTGIYIPSGPDKEIDDSQFTYGPKQSKPSESDARSSDFTSCESNSSEETHESMPETVVNEPTVVSQPKVWTDAPIIEEYESDSDDEHVSLPSKEQETPSFANTIKHVKTPRQTVKQQNTCSKSPKPDKKDCSGLMSKKLGLGYGFTTKACFVCGSLSHLIRDCDFHEKRMAKQVELNKQKGKGNVQRENKPVWNNVQRVNHKNQFVPTAVLTRTGKILVNTARASGTNNVSTARHNFNSQAVLTNVARKISTVKPFVNKLCYWQKGYVVKTSTGLFIVRTKRVLNSPCFMVKSWLVQDQTVLGKDYSNLLIADSLLKTIWFINAPCYGNEALASPKANGICKGTMSIPLMVDSLPKTVCCDAEEMRCKFKIESERETNFCSCGYSKDLRASGNTSRKQRTVICYNCKEEGHMSKQCTKPKRKRDDSWFKDKVLLVQAQASGQILHEEELAFLVDPGILEGQAT